MANEIKVNLSFQCENGSFKESFTPGQIQINQSAQGYHGPVVSVSTSGEAVAVGDISTLGWMVGRNLDTANYVTLGPVSTGSTQVSFMRIEAGEPFAVRLEPGISMRWTANTAAVKVQLQLYED